MSGQSLFTLVLPKEPAAKAMCDIVGLSLPANADGIDPTCFTEMRDPERDEHLESCLPSGCWEFDDEHEPDFTWRGSEGLQYRLHMPDEGNWTIILTFFTNPYQTIPSAARVVHGIMKEFKDARVTSAMGVPVPSEVEHDFVDLLALLLWKK